MCDCVCVFCDFVYNLIVSQTFWTAVGAAGTIGTVYVAIIWQPRQEREGRQKQIKENLNVLFKELNSFYSDRSIRNDDTKENMPLFDFQVKYLERLKNIIVSLEVLKYQSLNENMKISESLEEYIKIYSEIRQQCEKTQKDVSCLNEYDKLIGLESEILKKAKTPKSKKG